MNMQKADNVDYASIDHEQSIELLQMHKSFEMQRSAVIQVLVEKFRAYQLTDKQIADFRLFLEALMELELAKNNKSRLILGLQQTVN